MTHNSQNSDNSSEGDQVFYEYQFPLINWFHGTNFLLSNIITVLKDYLQTFQQLNLWKQQGLLFQKPSCSHHDVFVFWVYESLVSRVSKLQGVHGGYKVSLSNPFSENNPLPRRKEHSKNNRSVMLDHTVDHPLLIDLLMQRGLEVIRIWDLVADLVHYELIETCANRSIDLIVTADMKLFTSSEEWLNYLRSHRVKVCYVSKEYLNDLDKLSRFIYLRAYGKKEYDQENQDFYFNKSNFCSENHFKEEEK